MKKKPINKKDFGDQWPLTVDHGHLSCEKGIAAIFWSEGVAYQLNGQATVMGYEPIDPLWADNKVTGFKKDIGPLIKAALDIT